MVKSLATHSARLLMLLVMVTGLQIAECAQQPLTPVAVTMAPALTIPLGLNPSKTTLNPGEQVVISVISDEWRAADLAWGLSSSGLSSPGTLSATQGPTVIYTAPEGSGKVGIVVKGDNKGKVGSAQVVFSIEAKSAVRAVVFWTFDPNTKLDSKSADEFKAKYGVQVKMESFSAKDIPDKLMAAIAAGDPPDVVRFPLIDDAIAFGSKGLLDVESATRIISEAGKDNFDPKTLDQLLDANTKNWFAVPTKSQGALGITKGAANKSVAETWVTFLIQ